jgi:hypothetical protein
MHSYSTKGDDISTFSGTGYVREYLSAIHDVPPLALHA